MTTGEEWYNDTFRPSCPVIEGNGREPIVEANIVEVDVALDSYEVERARWCQSVGEVFHLIWGKPMKGIKLQKPIISNSDTFFQNTLSLEMHNTTMLEDGINHGPYVITTLEVLNSIHTLPSIDSEIQSLKDMSYILSKSMLCVTKKARGFLLWWLLVI